ncbi:hypothetical protein BDW62DRAFT_195955 [Aspergillus aurantiobrunneus]
MHINRDCNHILRYTIIGMIMSLQKPKGDGGQDVDDICDTLVELAFEAGKIITGALPDTDSTGLKENSVPSSRIAWSLTIVQSS